MKLMCWTTAQGVPTLFTPEALPPLVRVASPERGQKLDADPTNFAACLNAAARAAGEGLLVTLPPDVESLDPAWQTRFLQTAEANPQAVFFYGDYHVQDGDCITLQSVRADIGDITEREDWGPVWAVRVDWFNRIGGVDEQNGRAAFYDLLLKSWGQGRRVHIGGPIAVIRSQESAADAALKSKLFFPGRGKMGGFSYLFMDPEDERHTENVFYNFLKRENAWLERERTPIPGPSPTKVEEGRKITVSVVTPVYNRDRFIGKAIESVQKQSFTDWEYVIVDNGSTDKTREVVRAYAAKDPRVRLIENNINLIALSLNLGVRASRGKYISQLDSDDEYLPDTLKHMTTALESHANWGVAIGYYELMNEDGVSLPEFGIIKHLEYNCNNILRVDGAGAPRTWHRSVILEFGGFDEKELGGYGEDYDLVLKCGEKYEVGRVHEVCYRYRRHPDNTDAIRNPEMKIGNKTLARMNALKRRKNMNEMS